MNPVPTMSRWLRLAPLWVVLLAWIAHGVIIPAAFHPDDVHVIVRNPAVHTLAGIPRLFVDPGTLGDLESLRDLRPLPMTGLALLVRIAGDDPAWYRVWSVMLHALTALVLFVLVRALLLWTDSDELLVPTRAQATAAALVAGALFAVHTLAGGTVAAIGAQAVELMTLLDLLAILAYARFLHALEGGEAPGRSAGFMTLAVLAYAAALLSLWWAVTLPLVLLVYDVQFHDRMFVRRADGASSGTATANPWAGRVARLAPFALLALGALALRAALRLVPFGETLAREPVQGLLVQLRALPFGYLRRFLWPLSTGTEQRLAGPAELADPMVLGALAVLVLLAVAIVLVWRRLRLTAFCACWCGLAALPALVPLGGAPAFSEPRFTAALAALVIPVALLVVGASMRSPRRLVRGTLAGVTGAVIVALVVTTQLAHRDRRQALGAWSATAAEQAPGADPDAALHGGGFRMTLVPRGVVVPDGTPVPEETPAPDGTPVPAAPPAEPRSTASRVGIVDSLFADAHVLQRAGRRREAIALYDTLLAHDPDHVRALVQLAAALQGGDDPAETERAVVLLERAARLAPDDAGILYRLGTAHDRLAAQEPEASVDHARRAIAYYRRYLVSSDRQPALAEHAAGRIEALAIDAGPGVGSGRAAPDGDRR